MFEPFSLPKKEFKMPFKPSTFEFQHSFALSKVSGVETFATRVIFLGKDVNLHSNVIPPRIWTLSCIREDDIQES